MEIKKLPAFIPLLAAFFLLAAGPVPAKEIRFGHTAPTFHGQHVGTLAFARYVEEKTGGEIVVKSYPIGQLGPEMSMAEQVQAGTLEMTTISTAVLMKLAPQAGLIDLPFVFPDRETAYAVLADKEFQDKFFPYFRAKGLEAIGYTENEFRDMTNSRRPIRRPGDLKDLKMSVMPSPVSFDTFTQLGAHPVGIPFPELFAALRQGVIDGQENPLSESILLKVPEVNKFATRTRHALNERLIVVNPRFWASLTSERKNIFREAADLCLRTNRAYTAEAMKNLPGIGQSVDAYLAGRNVETIDLAEEERAAFVQAVRPVWDKYRGVAGAEFFDFFMKKIEEHSKK